MLAAIYKGLRSITIQEVDLPEPRPGYVLIQMEICGICGSDLHSYYGLWEQPATAHGHEVSGVIRQCGEGVTGFRPGDRVCMEWFAHCGSCRFCRTGAYNLCERIERTSGGSHSGFAEYVVAHVSSLFKVPEGLSPPEAAMIEPLAVAVRAHGRARGHARGTLLVMGAGTIGLLVTALGKIFGSARVITVARHPHQAERAAKWGAQAVILPGQTGIEERVRELTAGAWADAVVETTASADGLAAAVSCVRPSGRVVLVGGFHRPMEVDLKRVVDNEITITGCLCYSYTGLQRDFQTAIDLIASRRLDAGSLITHRFPLTDIEKALAAAADKRGGSIKVQIYNPEAGSF